MTKLPIRLTMGQFKFLERGSNGKPFDCEHEHANTVAWARTRGLAVLLEREHPEDEQYQLTAAGLALWKVARKPRGGA